MRSQSHDFWLYVQEIGGSLTLPPIPTSEILQMKREHEANTKTPPNHMVVGYNSWGPRFR